MQDTEILTPDEEKIIHAVVDAIGHNEAAYDKLVKSYGEPPQHSHGDKALQAFHLTAKHPDFEKKFNDLVAKPVMHKLQEHAPAHAKHFVQFFMWLAKVAVKIVKAIVQVAKVIKKAVEQHKAKVAAQKQAAAAAKVKQEQEVKKKRNWKIAAVAVCGILIISGIVYYVLKKE